jgi:LmbE family N-acetylglucosaminyl deacetylase
MEKNSLRLELRYVAERIKARTGMQRKLAATAWSPKVAHLPPGERFLVISPHPDDDVVGCGGTIAKLVGEGKKVKVAYLTLQPGNGYQAEVRRKEALEALGILGVTDFSFNEAQKPSDREIEKFLGQEIKASAPDTILLPNPVDNNDQHMQFSLCAVRVLKGLRNAPDVMLYEVWQPIAPNLIIEVSSFFGSKLEALRNAGVKNSLDAEAVFHVAAGKDTMAALIEVYLKELEDLLGVGHARMEKGASLGEGELVVVDVCDAREKYPRCERSWKRRPDVGSDKDYPTLSARDAAVMRELAGQ